MHSASDRGAAAAESAQSLIDNGDSDILNMMQVTSGQQVMLKVRVGEINREALKNLGIDLSAVGIVDGVNTIALGTGGGIGSLVAPASSSEPTILPGQFLLPGGRTPTNTRGIFSGVWRPGAGTFGGLVKALERDGLFKLLAEPNLVAVSGEQAEFLAGGEIPVPVVQGGSSSNNISVEYKPFGVAVRFTPFVLSENRVRMAVQPEVSEISTENAIRISGFDIPSISTRRAKTTIELAPGESFMIAGLIKDQMRATIDQVPGAKELPVLGALFRSNEFRRNETELVIAVTPYLVDPVRNDDIKLPTDNFRPANQMDMFFYGKLGGIDRAASAPSAGPEGPVGYMVD
jgi:pilus assembly protein CpaC